MKVVISSLGLRAAKIPDVGEHDRAHPWLMFKRLIRQVGAAVPNEPIVWVAELREKSCRKSFNGGPAVGLSRRSPGYLADSLTSMWCALVPVLVHTLSSQVPPLSSQNASDVDPGGGLARLGLLSLGPATVLSAPIAQPPTNPPTGTQPQLSRCHGH